METEPEVSALEPRVQSVHLILYTVDVGSSSSTQLLEHAVIVFLPFHPFTHAQNHPEGLCLPTPPESSGEDQLFCFHVFQ